MKPNEAMKVYSTFHANMIENELTYYLFNEELTKSIEDGLAVSATEASVKEGQMGGAWIITDVDKKLMISNQLYHKEWSDSI